MHKNISIFTALLATLFLSSPGWAGEAEEMAEMQKQLNAEVMSKPFDPGDPAKIDAYIEDALANDIQPVTQPPSYWQPGYTCGYIRQYRYDYNTYRNCLYHHRYYGRYW
jgi:hypothetical protein